MYLKCFFKTSSGKSENMLQSLKHSFKVLVLFWGTKTSLLLLLSAGFEKHNIQWVFSCWVMVWSKNTKWVLFISIVNAQTALIHFCSLLVWNMSMNCSQITTCWSPVVVAAVSLIHTVCTVAFVHWWVSTLSFAVSCLHFSSLASFYWWV